MTTFLRIAVLFAGALLVPGTVAAQSASQDSIWRNPQNSVHVRVHPCGKAVCGTVVWANDKAKADSARGGTPNLVGTELFQDFREVSPKLWRGKVFVPDLNHTFSGTGRVIDNGTIVARGCALGNIGCKSQTWTRVSSTDQ
jgi:uncharacterized protein (DUF2147 family)